MTPPSASTEAAVLSAEEVAEIRTSHTQLQALISQLLAKVDALPALAPAPAPMMLPAPQASGPFVPPIATVGLNGASFAAPLSLRTRFPDIDTSALAAIIMHEFKAADLHKLDPTNRDKETAYTFNGSTNQFELSHCAAREYKTPFSVLIPLQSYF
ncbi:hypothetical protein C0993_010550 [Termitomyces sp. T159_Od127]|nr:hypothetical protein C0993_010550 [Termitomyces sp. T159_Od127]